MKYAGLYVNMDRNPERREKIEAELARVGLGGKYERFRAVEGNELGFPSSNLKPGEVGCFSSHYRIMAEKAGGKLPLHVIEDDIVLSAGLEVMLDRLIESGNLAQYDLVFTDVYIPPEPYFFNLYKKIFDQNLQRDADGNITSLSFTLIDMAGVKEFASTCSFIVNPDSFGKLASLYEQELKQGARLPVDLYMRELCYAGHIKIGCLFPFLTSIPVESDYSTNITGRFDPSLLFAMSLMRHSFYVECNMKRCLDEASRHLPQPAEGDLHRQLMMRLLGYSIERG